MPMKLPEEVQEFFRKQGAAGGKARAESLSAKERREGARKAVQARWAKAKKKSAKLKSKGKSRGDK